MNKMSQASPASLVKNKKKVRVYPEPFLLLQKYYK